MKHPKIKNRIDDVFDAMIDFLDDSGALSIAMGQGGDYIGGKDSNLWRNIVLRKAMNSFFCRTDRPFKFFGLTNEDTNAYTLLGHMGKLFFTIAQTSLQQIDTQQNPGGLTDIYKEDGTYVKSFYTVMCMPSAAKVYPMGFTDMRLHHRISWENCVPKIISERYKKYGK